jgi:NTP pyrophosphatase (non-canonical NTP hydrolase)
MSQRQTAEALSSASFQSSPFFIFTQKPFFIFFVMTINEYQEGARRTAIYPSSRAIIYPTLGLTGEAGEVADKVKKVIRDNNDEFTPERRHQIALELGDVMWYAASLAHDLGYTLDDICQMNLDKLASRMQRDRIHGEGDER